MSDLVNRNILSYWTDKDLRIKAAHLLDLCENVLESGGTFVTPFLIPGQSIWLKNMLRRLPLNYLAWGGFEDAERVRFVLTSDKHPRIEQAQVSLIQVLPRDNPQKLKHRSILGSLMALGLEREVIGDIRQSKRGPLVAVTEQIKDYILQNWKNAGSNSIDTEVCKDTFALLPLSGMEKRVVAASMRLDAVVAAGFGISRSLAQEKIRSGKVQLNGIIIGKPDMAINSGDTLSCRGKGKLRILEENGLTRKGKTTLKIFYYTDSLI